MSSTVKGYRVTEGMRRLADKGDHRESAPGGRDWTTRFPQRGQVGPGPRQAAREIP